LPPSSIPAPLTQGRNSPSPVIFMLSLLMDLQPLSTDPYLPAMPALSDEQAGHHP
jgi:hypothetical protein